MRGLFAFLMWLFGVVAGLLSTVTTLLLIGWVVLLVAPTLSTVAAATVLAWTIKAAISMIIAWVLTGFAAICAVIG